MTIKPIVNDTPLRFIEEVTKRFFRNYLASVEFRCDVFRVNEDGTINTDPCISFSRKATSYTEVLVYLPELIQECFENTKEYETHSYYTTIILDIRPIVGKTVSLILDPIDFLPTVKRVHSSRELTQILNNFNNNEQQTLDRMVEKEQ